MRRLRSRGTAALVGNGLLAGLLSALVLAPAATAVAVPRGDEPSVRARALDAPVPQAAEPTLKKAPEASWPKAVKATLDLPTGSKGATASVVTVRPSKPGGADARKTRAAAVAKPADRAPRKVELQVLDRKKAEAAGGLGLAVRVARRDGGALTGDVDVSIDYSGFAHAYGGNFADRLRLIRLPACAATTPGAEACRKATYVPARNDGGRQTLTATVQAAPQVQQLSGMYAAPEPAVYTLTSGSSSDKGDYRASTLSPTGTWDVSLGSGAFTYAVPIDIPAPPMGQAPEVSLGYNSQAIDGRTSASNNQASWVGMGWDLDVGYIERRYKNCTQDGHPTFGDLCWDSPNSGADPNGANYVINLGGTTSELVQDNTGTGSFHLKDDQGWRVQKLNGGYGSDNTDEFWVITHQDGTRYYFGWGRTERLNSQKEHEKTGSVLTVPVVGDDEGEPCHASYPNPCKQAYRWNLDRVVTPNEVENSYFYKKETNFYRSVAAADKARSYDSASYLERIDYGWSSQIPGAQLPGQVDFQHVNRCVERMSEKDPLDHVAPDCPTIDAKPASYPDVPVDLICDGPEDGETCVGKTYFPTFFQRGMLWDILVKVRDTDAAPWDTVRQYQMKYALMDPSGAVGDQLWLDYIQRRGYAGDDVTLPTLNFNGEWQDNKVGDGGLNFRRLNKVFTDTGATISATYGHATDDGGAIDRQCDPDSLPSQSDNHYECFWQKWTPEGSETERSGWFKKFVVTRMTVDPGDLADGDPSMTTTYQYDGAPGWRFTADPIAKDEDESWSEWRGYGKVLVTTGAGTNRHSTYYWLYRGLDGDRTVKTDAAKTRTAKIADSDGKEWTDSPWLAGRTLETSSRDQEDKAQSRQWHEYWTHNTAQYTGLPDARFVREDRTRSLEKLATSSDDPATWREHIVENEYDDGETASTAFGLPMRIDDWGATDVSDNTCTEYGRAYNTDTLDGTGTKRWMVYQDDERHYSVSCTTQAEDQAAGQDTLHQDKRTVTFYDHATSFTENDTNLTDGNATELRVYTDAAAYRTARSDYDDAGRRTKAWDGKNNLTTTAYNPPTSWPLEGIATTTPDPDGTTGPGTAMTSTEYDSRFFGRPWKTVDANGNTTRVVYDAAGRLSKVFKPTESANYPDGSPTMRFGYEVPVAASATGVPDVATGADMKTSGETLRSGATYAKSVVYSDGLGREREKQEPAATGTGRTVTVTRYDSSGNVAGTSAPFYNSGATGSGPVNPAVADLPSYTDAEADWAGRTTLSQIQAGGVVQPVDKTVTRYGGADLTTVFPPTGGPVDTYTDVFGRTVKVVEHIGAESYTTSYEYTRSGNLKYIHDSRGNTTHYTYNQAGDRLTTEDPDAGASSTTYDANGQVETTQDANNTVLTYEYDNLMRSTRTKQGSTVLTSRTYDTVTGGKGLPAAATTYSGGQAYTTRVNGYDAGGRPTSKSVTVPDDGAGLQGSYTFGYGYDSADHVTSVDYPAIGGLPKETVTTEYTAQGRLSKVSGLTTYLSGTGYDAIGRLTSRSLGTAGTGTSLTRTFAYDDASGTGWLRNVVTDTVKNGTSTKVQDDTYARDAAGSVTALRAATDNQQECYRYDDLNRLTDAWTTAATSCGGTPQSDFAGPAPYQTKYSYDRLGNIQSVVDTTQSGSTTEDYAYAGYSADESSYTPDQPHPHAVASVTSPSGKDTYGYDAAGQLKTRTRGGVASTLDWNPQRQLASVTQKKTGGDETTRYVYDPEGNVLLRASKQENVLYLDGHELHKAGTAAAKATRYYTAGDASLAMRTADGSANGLLTWLLGDGQASTQLAVSVAGVVTRRRYTPFGAQRGATGLAGGSDRGFLGKEEDDSTGFSLLGARIYDPGLGRFLSTDPVQSPYEPQKLSSYSYSANDPVNYSDPTGLDRACRCGHRPPLVVNGRPTGQHTSGGIPNTPRGPATAPAPGCDQACRNALNALVVNQKGINKRLAIELRNYVYVLGGNMKPCVEGAEVSSGVAAGCADLQGQTSNVVWQDVLQRWLDGKGGALSFGAGAKITQQLSNGPHNRELLKYVSRAVDADWDLPPSMLGGDASYSDPKTNIAKDIWGMYTDGQGGTDTPDAFLGSFNEVYQVVNIDKKKREFTVAVAAFNDTGTKSLFHLPDWTGIGMERGQGKQMASVHQTYYYTMTVRE